MRRTIVVALLVIVNTTSSSADSPAVECKKLYQAWVLNSALEETCGFGGMLSYRLGAIAKQRCDSVLSRADRDKYGIEVAVDLKKDYDKMGKQALCDDARPGYNALVAALTKKADSELKK